jgi:hypothetical protein
LLLSPVSAAIGVLRKKRQIPQLSVQIRHRCMGYLLLRQSDMTIKVGTPTPQSVSGSWPHKFEHYDIDTGNAVMNTENTNSMLRTR